MNFNDDIHNYLTGKKFSNSLKIHYSPNKYKVQTRVEIFIEMVKEKNIIHLGCTDHLELIEDKIKKNKWLHGNFLQNAHKCVGFDINNEAITYLQKQHNIPNLYYVDIEKENDFSNILGDNKWDFIILGELIEHVNNPVAFLRNIHTKFKESTSKILISAPNVLTIYNAKKIKKNIEVINSDHRYWFSPYTLTKILLESGFKNYEIQYAEHVPFPLHQEVIKHTHRLLGIPYFLSASYFSTIIISADF